MMMRTSRAATECDPARMNSGNPGRRLACIGLFALLAAAPALCLAQHRDHVRGGANRGFSAMQRNEYGAPAARTYRDGGGFERAAERGSTMRVANRRDFRTQHGQDARQPPERNRQQFERGRQEQRQSRPDYRQQARSNEDGNAHTDAHTDARGNSHATRRGQEHLPQWWQAHRGLSPRQQAEALRRQPGFQNLPQRQQQRLIHRLRDFGRRTPTEQQRTLDRVEMFERLSPERRQEVRGASQALSRMPPDRQRTLRHAFHELRQMPPEQRRRMLHSSYGAQFTPQERTVLGNLLSIEPYQPQGQIAQPYFGRR